MKPQRHDQQQIVLRAGERHVQQPPLLLDELRLAVENSEGKLPSTTFST